MAIKESIKGAVKGIFNRKTEVYADNETKDKYLRSLRRQRRIQLEEIEKKQLIKDIADFEHEKTKQNMFGMDSDNNMLKSPNLIIPNKIGTNPKPMQKSNMLSDNSMLRPSPIFKKVGLKR